MPRAYQGKAVQEAPQQKPPLTESGQQALVNRRNDIKQQLEELTDRRRELQSQRDQMNPVSGRGHEQRMAVIDQRSAQLEQELFAINDQLSGVVSREPVEQAVTVQPDDFEYAVRKATEDAVFEAVSISVFSLLGIWVFWRGFRRWIWRAKKPALGDGSAQIMQLQQSMDAMAIEIERISEAQRFSAKLLNDRVLSQGDAQPVGAAQRESVGARKRS